MENTTTIFFPIWARWASPFLVWSDCSGVNISILVKRKYNKMWTGSIGCLCCVNITVPSFDVNPNSLLQRDTFFVKIFQLYKVRTVEISKIEIHIKLWAFEVVPFHYLSWWNKNWETDLPPILGKGVSGSVDWLTTINHPNSLAK